MRELVYECPSCHNCYTAREWNEYNKSAIIIFGMTPMPEAIYEEGNTMDCPSCGERNCCEDMNEY